MKDKIIDFAEHAGVAGVGGTAAYVAAHIGDTGLSPSWVALIGGVATAIYNWSRTRNGGGGQ